MSDERNRLALCGLIAAAAFPAGAQSHPPTAPWTPWSVESPGPLGARFGLGLDLALDRLDDAEVVGGTQSVTTIGADGSPRTTVTAVDVELTNRKHRQGWEERSLGFQAPLALPPFRLGALRVEPSLVLEAVAVEGELTFADLVEREPDRSLDGTAARWGAGVQALGELCRGCRWFWSAGYRYRSLSGLDLGVETQGEPGGPTVTQSVEIDRDAHHLDARLGALLAGGRATVYVGVRDRRSDLVVRDDTTVTSPRGGPSPSTVLTRLELDGDDTAALVGADFRLGRSLVGRVEGTFGDGGESVLVKVVSLPGLWGGDAAPRPFGRAPRPSADEPPRRDTPEEVERQRRRADELADELAPRAEVLRQRFDERARQLLREAGPRGALPAGAVRALLDEVEAELRQILDAPELRPALAWFVDFAERSRRALDAPSASVSHRRSPWPRPTGSYHLAAFSPTPQRDEDRGSGEPGRGIVAAIGRFLDTLTERADSRQLAQPLCVRSLPSSGAYVFLSAALPDSDEEPRRTEGRWDVFYRGLYAYRAQLDGRRFSCLPGSDCSAFLDFWDSDGPFVLCDFDAEVCVIDQGDGATCGGR